MRDYIGRFAPSPSGPLHMGSLAAALASYLQARCRNGQWLVRIEDIDPPREPSGAAAAILECLAAHHLIADGEISYQSDNHPHYDHALQQLHATHRLFGCHCTRAQLKAAALKLSHNTYPGTCKNASLPFEGSALRLKLNQSSSHQFVDSAQGLQSEDLGKTCGDFVLRRRDGLYAYQLAVVVDDARQGITQVVRGVDLLDNTVRQIHLQQALGYQLPDYLHIPVLLDESGLKLSKQNHAPALDLGDALRNLEKAWSALGQLPLPKQLDCAQFLAAAQKHWDPSRLRYSLSK